MSTSRTLLVLAMAAAALVGTAMGVDHTVGAPTGSWDLRTDYATWASGLTFRVGDRLVFTYSAAAHDVVEVNKANYDACSISNAITTVQNGSDTFPLTAAGSRYFICGVPTHCTSGMKVQVNVQAGAPAAGGAPSPVNTPAGLPAPSPSTKTPATPSSSPASVGAGSLGGAVAVAALTMMLFN